MSETGNFGGDMKRLFAVLALLLLPLARLEPAGGQNSGHLVLPNPKLLRCGSSDCFQIWSEGLGQNDISPKQVIIDLDHGCIYGMTAIYEKEIPLDRLKAEIDGRYRQWSVDYPSGSDQYLWRVEAQKFAVHLSVASKMDEKRNFAEVGTRQVMYIAFGGKSACGTP